ncbi:MAG: alpha/beta hydrolase [Acidimicrobiia bacterium]|nr:alpha/beta hydrolase [Acidimicrobiia bacterium]
MSIQILETGDGVPAALHDLGGDGPALLLTHGNGLNAGMWATVVPHLRDRFHCYGLDFRGHGASRPATEDFSVERDHFVREVLAAVDALGGAPVLGAGHSLGAATMVRTELDHPGTFSALFVFEPVLIPDTFDRPEGPSLLIELSRKRRMIFASADEAFERFRSKPPYSECEADAVRAYVDLGTYPLADGTVRLSCSGETEARIYGGGSPMDFSTFAACTCPIVVGAGAAIAGGNDIPPRMAPLVAEALGNGTLQMFEGLTHFAPMEDGAAIAAAIRTHLGRAVQA